MFLPAGVYIGPTVNTKTLTRLGFRIAVLLVFAAVTLGINFLHTECGPRGRSDCPACHFLTSSLSTSPGVVFLPPGLLFLGTLASVEFPISPDVVVLSRCSRSPPSA
jgi:hypothetical protein